MNKTLKLFYEFLEANGALIGWEQHTVEQQIRVYKRNRAEYFHWLLNSTASNPASRFIISAFKWNETPEGFNYWDQLDDKWRIHLKQNI